MHLKNKKETCYVVGNDDLYQVPSFAVNEYVGEKKTKPNAK